MREGHTPPSKLACRRDGLNQISGGLYIRKLQSEGADLRYVDLIPPGRKHTFFPEIDLSELIDDEIEFQALTGLNWASPNFQATEEEEEEPA